MFFSSQCAKHDDMGYQDICQIAKDIVKQKGNLEAHEILMITDTEQCRPCYTYATPRHTSCKCGIILLRASEEVQKQVLKNGINWFNVLTTSAFVFKTGTQRVNNWLQRRLPSVRQSGVSITKSAVKGNSIKKHSRAISERRLVSTDASVSRCHRGDCQRVAQRTRRNGCRT